MNKIDNTDAFINAVIKNKNRLVCETNGTWRLESGWKGRLMRIVRWLVPPLEDIRLLRIAKAFNTFLDNLEAPIEFATQDATRNYQKFIEAGEKLNNYMKRRKPSYILKSYLTASINRLQYRVIALKYRCETANGGEDPIHDIDTDKFDALKAIATKWKNHQPFPASVSDDEAHMLEDACRFPLFLDQLLSDPLLQETFFKWTFRYHNPVQAFIEFPATQNKLSVSMLSSRVGLYNLLKVQGKDAAERAQMGITNKDLVIPCQLQNHSEPVPCSILDNAAEITFKGGYTLSWKQIYEIFEKKNKEFGNIEAFPHGIDNWNPSKLGWWNAQTKEHVCVDLTQDNWWMQIPSTQELSINEAHRRYSSFSQDGSLTCDGTNWVYTIMMTRRSRTLELGGTHAYGEIAIPVDDPVTGLKKYKVITLSMFPGVFPQSVWDYPKAIAGTFPAVVASPDLSIYVLSRERFGPSYEMTHKEGHALMEVIKKKIQLGRDGTLGYQMLTVNCRVFSEGIIREVLGESRVPKDLSETSFWESEPRGAVGTVFNLIKKTPIPLRKRLTHAVFYPAGSTSSHTVHDINGNIRPHSLYNNDAPWDIGILGAPSVWMRKFDKKRQQQQQSSSTLTISNKPLKTPSLVSRWKKKICKVWSAKMNKSSSKVNEIALSCKGPA